MGTLRGNVNTHPCDQRGRPKLNKKGNPTRRLANDPVSSFRAIAGGAAAAAAARAELINGAENELVIR